MYYRYLNINELNIDEISNFVSERRLLKAEKYKNENDRKRSIAVEYLLNEMIKEHFGKFGTYTFPLQIIYDEKGKPHLSEDAVNFSLSHSGDYVACIISDRLCGIDIEKHKERDYKIIAKRVCTQNESVHIRDKKAFYDVWTMKESVLKAVGIGIALDMRKVEIVNSQDILLNDDNGKRSYVVKAYCDNDIKTYEAEILPAPVGYSLSYAKQI